MQYRKFGKTNEKISILGFGAMRLPVINDNYGQIDEEKAISMIRRGIDKGINYLDTAYVYHEGNSESFCSKVMKDGYRDKINIATKLPCWEVKTYADFDRLLNEQMERLEVETIDFYLLHALNVSNWKIMKDNDYISFLNKAKSEGKIRYAGFSFHDNIELFKEIIDDYEWDFCQIQLNYLDEQYQAGIEGMRYAASKDIGVIIMEPLRGGMLSRSEIPEELENIFSKTNENWSQVGWALNYLWDFPEVGIVLSGMSDVSQLDENIEIASNAKPGMMNSEEKKLIEDVKSFYKERIIVNCTNCRYCLPCPSGVYIPEVFWAYNHASMFGDEAKAKFWLTGWLKEDQRASNCISCGKCEIHCPQNIEISKHMEIISKKYE